jgi:hypothetical protein
MVVVDTSVFLHKIHQSYSLDPHDPQLESVVKANLVWLMSGAWLGQELRPLFKQMVFAKDSKPYWRSDWLADIHNTINLPRNFKTKAKAALAEKVRAILDKGGAENNAELDLLEQATPQLNVAYKAGRAFPDKAFSKIERIARKTLDELNAQQLYARGYEADDMAAALVATSAANGSPWSIMLLTVDSDWMGLINPAVTWVCMSGFTPVVRDSLEVCNSWVEPRLKAKISNWREIWDIKGNKGDSCDNLPPSEGQLLPVIDLLNPPESYKFWKTKGSLVNAKFTETEPLFDLEQAKKAKKHLKLNGFFPVVRVLPGQDLEPSELSRDTQDLSEMVALLADMATLPSDMAADSPLPLPSEHF